VSLKDEIVGNCEKCGRTGYIGSEICECFLKFRSYNRLIDKGFSRNSLDISSSVDYTFPHFESGRGFVDYFLENPAEVESKGLTLYIFSNERGRGKTTLSHYIMWKMALAYSHTKNYRRENSLSFGFNRSRDVLGGERKFVLPTFYVLDDLGSEGRSPQWKKELVISDLQELMHKRRDFNLPTIITSNYHPSSLSNIYDGVLDSLLEIKSDGNIGGSLIRQVELGGGEDFRFINNNGWPGTSNEN